MVGEGKDNLYGGRSGRYTNANGSSGCEIRKSSSRAPYCAYRGLTVSQKFQIDDVSQSITVL
jgi:hypothetical protein